MPPSRKRKRQSTSVLANRWAAAKRRVRQRTNPMRRPNYAYIARQNVRLGPGPVPPSVKVKLRYSATYASTGAALDRRFSLNSIFSPEASGGGHQPLGRDQYATFYNRYRVNTCRVTVQGSVDGLVSIGPALVTVLADNANSGFTDPFLAGEQQGAVAKIVPETHRYWFRKTYDCAKVTGVTKAAYLDDRFQALMSTNPAEAIIFHVIDSTVAGGNLAAGHFKYTVTMDFDVTMFDPLALAQS